VKYEKSLGKMLVFGIFLS